MLVRPLGRSAVTLGAVRPPTGSPATRRVDRQVDQFLPSPFAVISIVHSLTHSLTHSHTLSLSLLACDRRKQGTRALRSALLFSSTHTCIHISLFLSFESKT